MKPLLITLGVLVVIGLIVASSFSGSYNSLVTQNTTVDTSWANLQAEYQRRFDLVPNLVAATQGALTQEQDVFGAIAEARTHYAGAAQGSSDQVAATSQYDSAISRLMVIVENYPQLQSIQSIKNLTDELAGTENRVEIARDRYNAQVQVYNTMISRFPMNLFAHFYGFSARTFFNVSTPAAANAPTVKLNQ